jgi:hypothetical protein
MECHDVQQLLAFVNRPSEELDVTERDAMREHLATCPDCAARLQADRRADETFGPILRNVAVPADLKQKILHRLSANRPRPWKTWLAAAAVVLVSVGAAAWAYRPLPEVNLQDLQFRIAQKNWDEDAINAFFKDEGLQVKVPGFFDYQYVQHVDVIEFKDRRVGRLLFSRMENPAAVAELLILPKNRFKLDELMENRDEGQLTRVRIWNDAENPDFIYVICYRGNINELLRRQF